MQVTAVPTTTRKPGAYMNIDTSGARLGLAAIPDRVLLVGVKTSAGTATALVAKQIYSAAEARTAFGPGSPLALMVAAFLAQHPNAAELWAIPQAEAGSSVAASATCTFAVASLVAGTLLFYIGGHVVTVGVTAADTGATLATALAAAISADTTLPFSAAVDGSTVEKVNFTCKAKGTDGNDWVLYAEYSGTGLTATLVQPASGATDPDMAAALLIAFPEKYDVIISQYNDASNLGDLKDHLDSVSGAMEQRPGVGIAGVVASVGTATTLTSGINSGRISMAYLRGTQTHPYEIAAAYGAALVAEGDRARPLNNVALKQVLPPLLPANRLTRTEQESCLLNGAACLEVIGGTVRIVRSVSTYVENSSGDADDTLLDIQTIRVLDYVAYVILTTLRQELGQVKIASSAVTANTTDPDKIRALVLAKLLQLQNELGYLERVTAWKDRLVVERDGSNPNRVNITIPADIVDGLHIVAGNIQLILG